MMKVVLALCALLGACSGSKPVDTYARMMAEADRAGSAGRHAEAASRYEEAARTAKRPRDREHAAYLAALASARAGDERAVTKLEEISRADPKGEHAAEAAYRAAELRLRAGDAGAWAALEQVFTKFPNSGVSRPALRRFLAHVDEEKGKAASLAYLDDLAPKVDKAELAEDVAYQRANRLADTGDFQRARDAYLAMADRWPYPFGSLWDDALYRASEMDEKLGRYREAIADLERMLKEREEASTMGSYERPKYTPALLRIAQLYADKLHDRERARDTYHRLYSEFSHSIMRDDALWKEAELWRADGNEEKACSRLSTLVSDFPDSRYVPCAVDRCKLKRPEKSKAPATCHPYITRDKPVAD
jgi:TolA-binding protein